MSTFKEPDLLSKEADQLVESLGLPASWSSLGPKDKRSIPQQDMPTQDPIQRGGNMDEVALGYTENQAIVEASRCLVCKNAPCIKGCPVNIDIPGFVSATAKGNFEEALGIIQESSMLPAICGRVCPQEKQCMELCTVGKMNKDPMESVAIGRLERYLADRGADNKSTIDLLPSTGKKVAIVGSGPSGLTTAADLARLGHEVVVFEAFHKAGGVTVYGIPEFRLPKSIVQREVGKLESMGVKFIYDYLIGRTRTVKELMEKDGFNAVYVANGAGLPKFMNIDGENLVGVFSANEYLTRSNLMKAFDKKAMTPIYPSKKVAVFGGGNVAMDAARTALRLGAQEVHIVYRRTGKEMPARVEEVHHAQEEGIIFDLLTNPVRIIGNDKGRVTGIECLKYKLGEPDASGRARPEPIEGSEFFMEIDTCITALGNGSNPLVTGTTPQLDTNKWGNITVDEKTGATSMKGVFAGGDIVQGAATVILAMGDGRVAAKGIDEYLKTI